MPGERPWGLAVTGAPSAVELAVTGAPQLWSWPPRRAGPAGLAVTGAPG